MPSISKGARPDGGAQPPALVLGTGITALGVVRSLGRSGIPLHVISAAPAFIQASRWHRPPPHQKLLPDFALLAEYLRKFPVDRAVLIPTSDHAALAIGELPPDLAERFPASQAPAPVIAALTDKQEFARLLDRFEVPHPRTIVVQGEDAIEAIPDTDIAGFFIKPRDSQAFDQQFGVKALWPADRQHLRRMLRKIASARLSVVLQEYIPGPPTNHYFLDGFIDAKGSSRARLTRRRLRMSPPVFGNSCATISVSPEEAAPAASALERLLSSIAYRGPYDAEFKQDDRNGVFHLVEINVRPWWQAEFVALCGVDVVTMCYRDALGLPVGDVQDYRIGVKWLMPYEDLAAWALLLKSGKMSLGDVGEFLHAWCTSHWAGYAIDDPIPGVVLSVDTLGRIVRRASRRDRMDPDPLAAH